MANPELLEQYREQTRDIIEEVLQDGSDPDALYLIEHHVCSQNAAMLEQVMQEAFRLGFEVDEPEEITLDDGSVMLCCDLVAESPLIAEIIDNQVAQLLELTDKYQVDYDGWGTWFEDDEASDDDGDDDDELLDEDDNGVRH